MQRNALTRSEVRVTSPRSLEGSPSQGYESYGQGSDFGLAMAQEGSDSGDVPEQPVDAESSDSDPENNPGPVNGAPPPGQQSHPGPLSNPAPSTNTLPRPRFGCVSGLGNPDETASH